MQHFVWWKERENEQQYKAVICGDSIYCARCCAPICCRRDARLTARGPVPSLFINFPAETAPPKLGRGGWFPVQLWSPNFEKGDEQWWRVASSVARQCGRHRGGGGGEISSGPGFGMVEAAAGGGGPAAATPPEWRAEGGIGKLFASFCDGMNPTRARYT